MRNDTTEVEGVTFYELGSVEYYNGGIDNRGRPWANAGQTRIHSCGVCGCTASDLLKHVAWHKSKGEA